MFRFNTVVTNKIKYSTFVILITTILNACTQSPVSITDQSDYPNSLGSRPTTKRIPGYSNERPDIREMNSNASKNEPVITAKTETNKNDAPNSSKASADANSYTVKKGDTLYSIGRMTGYNAVDIAHLNNLVEPYPLSLGQILRLPNKQNATASTSASSKESAKSSNKANIYIVKQGDTLYSISRDTGIDVLSLISYNKISAPDSLRLGQELKLPPSKISAVDISSTSINIEPTKKADSKSSTAKTDKNNAIKNETKIAKRSKNSINWAWPAKGKAEKVKNGINIKGQVGDKVLASAAGKVLYINNDVPGYGNLIIIKHNDDYLTAYANNQRFLVKEQEHVKAGQQIATMGKDSDNNPNLHFEIRYRTDSVNPLDLLPKK